MNHLQGQASLYLRQHVEQPVDWYPWGRQALDIARHEQKPILLSIGYSACHWCHVMAHECFDDPNVAAVMNELFVNIKVDREERPDLDKIYQQAHYLLNQRSGGWPLNVVVTPDEQIPFFSGTYFPKQARHGMPPFVDVLRHVARIYRDNRDDVENQNRRLLDFLQHGLERTANERTLNLAPLDTAVNTLHDSFDRTYGGFGSAPKFPHPSTMVMLTGLWRAGGEHSRGGYDMTSFSLEKMARGGLADQLGGGFFRYSVDERWTVPHFEKMLYDNGPLLELYAQYARWDENTERRALFTDTADGIVQWLLREMRDEKGGFYATLDADSEGEEGGYYLWAAQQWDALLDEGDAAWARQVFGLNEPANFEGQWHLQRLPSVETRQGQYHHIVKRLLGERQRRVGPDRDEKIITAWNALMIKGLAVAGRLLNKPDYIQAAEQAVDFIRENVFVDNRLFSVYQDGGARQRGYLDDYAYLIDALLALLQARWRNVDMEMAIALTESMLHHFYDEGVGAFYFTADDSEKLFHRPMNFTDDATPAGNAVAVQGLTRMGTALGNESWLQTAEKVVRTAWSDLEQFPHAHCALLNATMQIVQGEPLVVLRGEPAELKHWRQALLEAGSSHTLWAIPSQIRPAGILDKPALGPCTAYVCHATQCAEPVEELGRLKAILRL